MDVDDLNVWVVEEEGDASTDPEDSFSWLNDLNLEDLSDA